MSEDHERAITFTLCSAKQLRYVTEEIGNYFNISFLKGTSPLLCTCFQFSMTLILLVNNSYQRSQMNDLNIVW